MKFLLKNKSCAVVSLLFCFLFAGPAEWLNPNERSLTVLPPQVQEKDNIVYELSAAIVSNNYLFELTIDNQALDKITVDTGKQIFFNSVKPDLYTVRSEQVTILPNERYQKKLYFREQKLRAGEKYQFNINGVAFYVFYAEAAAELKTLMADDPSVLEYNAAGFYLRSKGSGSMVLINNSGQNISRVLFVSGNDLDRRDLKKLDHKHWYLSADQNFDEAGLILIKTEGPDYQVFSLSKNTINKRQSKPRPVDQYSLTLFPPAVRPAGEFEVRLHLLKAVKPERATVEVFGESYPLRPQKNNFWQSPVKLPPKTYPGRYPVKLYLKDADGVLVLTEEIEVL